MGDRSLLESGEFLAGECGDYLTGDDTFAIERHDVADWGVDPIQPGDGAFLRIVVDSPCVLHVDIVDVNGWTGDALVREAVKGGFRFDILNYQTGAVMNIPSQVAIPFPDAVFSWGGNDRGSLSELVRGTRVKIYGRKSPRSNVLLFYRVEKY